MPRPQQLPEKPMALRLVLLQSRVPFAISGLCPLILHMHGADNIPNEKIKPYTVGVWIVGVA